MAAKSEVNLFKCKVRLPFCGIPPLTKDPASVGVAVSWGEGDDYYCELQSTVLVG